MAPVRLSHPTLSRPLTPHSVNNDFAWLCNSWDHLPNCTRASRGTHLATGYFCSVRIYVYKLHLQTAWNVTCSYVVLCLLLQLLCRPGEKVSAVPTSPLLFFQPLSSFLAYHGFSEQCTQWDKSETIGSVNRISNPSGYFSTPNSLRVRQDPTLGF